MNLLSNFKTKILINEKDINKNLNQNSNINKENFKKRAKHNDESEEINIKLFENQINSIKNSGQNNNPIIFNNSKYFDYMKQYQKIKKNFDSQFSGQEYQVMQQNYNIDNIDCNDYNLKNFQNNNFKSNEINENNFILNKDKNEMIDNKKNFGNSNSDNNLNFNENKNFKFPEIDLNINIKNHENISKNNLSIFHNNNFYPQNINTNSNFSKLGNNFPSRQNDFLSNNHYLQKNKKENLNDTIKKDSDYKIDIKILSKDIFDQLFCLLKNLKKKKDFNFGIIDICKKDDFMIFFSRDIDIFYAINFENIDKSKFFLSWPSSLNEKTFHIEYQILYSILKESKNKLFEMIINLHDKEDSYIIIKSEANREIKTITRMDQIYFPFKYFNRTRDRLEKFKNLPLIIFNDKFLGDENMKKILNQKNLRLFLNKEILIIRNTKGDIDEGLFFFDPNENIDYINENKIYDCLDNLKNKNKYFQCFYESNNLNKNNFNLNNWVLEIDIKDYIFSEIKIDKSKENFCLDFYLEDITKNFNSKINCYRVKKYNGEISQIFFTQAKGIFHIGDRIVNTIKGNIDFDEKKLNSILKKNKDLEDYELTFYEYFKNSLSSKQLKQHKELMEKKYKEINKLNQKSSVTGNLNENLRKNQNEQINYRNSNNLYNIENKKELFSSKYQNNRNTQKETFNSNLIDKEKTFRKNENISDINNQAKLFQAEKNDQIFENFSHSLKENIYSKNEKNVSNENIKNCNFQDNPFSNTLNLNQQTSIARNLFENKTYSTDSISKNKIDKNENLHLKKIDNQSISNYFLKNINLNNSKSTKANIMCKSENIQFDDNNPFNIEQTDNDCNNKLLNIFSTNNYFENENILNKFKNNNNINNCSINNINTSDKINPVSNMINIPNNITFNKSIKNSVFDNNNNKIRSKNDNFKENNIIFAYSKNIQNEFVGFSGFNQKNTSNNNNEFEKQKYIKNEKSESRFERIYSNSNNLLDEQNLKNSYLELNEIKSNFINSTQKNNNVFQNFISEYNITDISIIERNLGSDFINADSEFNVNLATGLISLKEGKNNNQNEFNKFDKKEKINHKEDDKSESIYNINTTNNQDNHINLKAFKRKNFILENNKSQSNINRNDIINDKKLKLIRKLNSQSIKEEQNEVDNSILNNFNIKDNAYYKYDNICQTKNRNYFDEEKEYVLKNDNFHSNSNYMNETKLGEMNINKNYDEKISFDDKLNYTKNISPIQSIDFMEKESYKDNSKNIFLNNLNKEIKKKKGESTF